MAAGSVASIVVHDGDVPADAAVLVDDGIDHHNTTRAPLHDVRALACIAWLDGCTIGGAVGRTWGQLAELQQIWLDEAQRRHGVGRQLMQAFEATAAGRGCTQVYLDTFSFQAPHFYRALGYRVVLKLEGYAPGITKFTMLKSI